MKPQLRKLVLVAGLGASGGIAFLFVCFVLGIDQPDLYGNRGTRLYAVRGRVYEF